MVCRYYRSRTQKYQVVCVMRDNTGENWSNEIFEFLNSHGIPSYFSEAYEQWQNGSAESETCRSFEMSGKYDWEIHSRGLPKSEGESNQATTTSWCRRILIFSRINWNAVVNADSFPCYLWLYGMETKDGMLEVLKKWYADITDLGHKNTKLSA